MSILCQKPTFRLGEILVKKNYITNDILQFALHLQTKCKSQLGKILLTEGLINSNQLYTSLAEQLELEFINLITHPCDISILSPALVKFYIKYQAIPWKYKDNTMVIAVSDLNHETLQWIKANFPNYKLVMTSTTQIQWNIEKFFSQYHLYDSINHLKHSLPNKSSHFTFCRWQKISIILLIFFIIISFKFFTTSTVLSLFIATNLLYLCSNIFKTILYIAGIFSYQNKEKENLELIDSELPIYTILLPLLHEQEVLPRLIFSINSLNYPKSKLDIKLIIEEDDHITLNAIKNLHCGDHFQLIIVPKSFPCTKPKALNYALKFARGTYITIYDAEDRPEPNQLRKVIKAFQNASDDVICMQAKLNFFNREENLLSKFFALEYSLLFDVILWGVSSLKMPIPLGGTSNHFIRDKLEQIGKWDPFNVTEDADLGIRLSSYQYKTQILNSITLEESPLTLLSWIIQRSRWIKGYILTYLVHMRNPKLLLNSLGVKGFLGIQFFIGLPAICFLTAPIMWFGSFVINYNISGSLISQTTYYLWYINLIYCFILPLISASFISYFNKWPHMILSCLLFPFYFILHSIASFRAVWYLIFAPTYWDKTPHGISDYI
ncbi:N-glycosyltransferase [Rickettsiales bacterium Ac37b]|nr:N-glycosyltransferase [Rickettsiales bacterium Ac37b]